MTIINLSTQDQQLINASRVVIAAGDVNSVELHVDFDSAWEGFTVRSATFYTSKNSAVQEMLLLNDKCIVPFEVLEESCILFIGVRGVTADGEAVKTSSLVKYKIAEGATAGDKTLTPTMDLYQQYLAALKMEASPLVAEAAEAALAEMKAEAEALNASVRETASELVRTVLWENPNPENGLAATTIEMDLSAFKSFRVVYANLCSNTTTYGFGEQTISTKGIRYNLVGHTSENYRFRGLTISDTGIEIADTGTPYSSASESANKYIVPVQIIGYKY